MKTVIIIGGGASGMAAAVSCSRKNRVILLERNEKLGKKVYITGKARCNVTNDAEMSEHMKNVVSNPRFLYKSYAAFDKEALKEFLIQNGCPVKTERGKRVFPASDHASDVIKAFERAIRESGTEVRLNTKVTGLLTEGDEIKGVMTDAGAVKGDAVIVATGGVSYKATGSTGDGYRFAREAGHSVTQCFPALTSLITEEAWPEMAAGLTLKNTAVRFIDPEKPKKPVFTDFGELLFTHRGVSGPVVLSASSYLTEGLAKGKTYLMQMDLKPALDEQALDQRLLRDFSQNQNRAMKNSLSELLPSSLIPVVLEEAAIDPDKKVHDIRKEERAALLKTLKCLQLTICGTGGFDEAIVTQGGVSVREIDPSTLQSKKIRGLYFAGEVLDVDALTGGFNLQIAWSTGYLAGSSIE